MSIRSALTVLVFVGLAGCAQPFLRPGNVETLDTLPNGDTLFAETFRAHGGDQVDRLDDVSVRIEGEWKKLITRIQPLVTDFRYRVNSEERLLPKQGIYAALYTGPDGNKKVVRTPDNTRVFYNGLPSTDEDVIRSTSLTAESFLLFLLGPLALADRQQGFVRIEDGSADGRSFYRIYRELEPGLGESARDELVLWIDKESKRTFRVNITLEGFRTTQGAHVDVTYLDYVERSGFVFPSTFIERVLAPINIDAHAWSLTGLDINRGITPAELDGAEWTGAAATDAAPLDN